MNRVAGKPMFYEHLLQERSAAWVAATGVSFLSGREHCRFFIWRALPTACSADMSLQDVYAQLTLTGFEHVFGRPLKKSKSSISDAQVPIRQ